MGSALAMGRALATGWALTMGSRGACGSKAQLQARWGILECSLQNPFS